MRLLVSVVVAVLALAAPVAANVSPEPTYDEGGEPHYDFTSNQNLFAVHLADVQGGDVCILDGETVDDGNLSCDSPAWGSKNHVGSKIGTGWTLIETPFLRTGTWVLLGDGPTSDHVSGQFTVHPCAPGDCDTRIAEAVAARYKAAAFNSAMAMLGMKGITALLTKINPTEPFGHFKNALNDALKKAAQSSAIYMRILAKEADKRLKPVTEAPDGPNAMALAILKNVVDGAFEMYMDIVNDPPADYAEVAEPVFNLSPLSAGVPEIDAMALDVAQMTGYGAAGRKAFERYQLAAAESNDLGVHRQAAAIAGNTFALVENMYEAADGFDTFADRLAADPEWAGAKVVQEHVDTLEPIIARIKASGFDEVEHADLDADGFDATGKAALRAKLEDLPLDDVPIDKPFETVLREAATTLRTEAPAFDEMARTAEAVAHGTNSAPQAGFTTSAESGPPPLTVTFTDTSTDPDDKDELTVTWDFGDGSTATGASVQHTFAAGEHTVTQTVSDGHLSATATRTITAATPNEPPVAAFTATPEQGDAPLEVSFDASGSTDDGGVASYDWDFGDNSPHESGATAQHTYDEPGNYLVKLTVTDDKGASDSTEKTITVSSPANEPPVAVIAASPESGDEPLEVTLDGSGSSDPDGTIVAHEWNFGDGSGSTAASPTHTFYGGTPTVTLTVTDDKGAKGTVTKVLSINRKPVASFTMSTSAGRLPLTVQFDASGSADPDDGIAAYEWDFGDGATGTGRTASHEFTAEGTHTVTLKVTDEDGSTATSQQNVSATVNVAPASAFTATPDHGPAPLVVHFADMSGDPNGDPLTVSWDFGDGATATGKNVQHTFAEGRWTVRQTVSDGLESATSERVILAAAPPVPRFDHAPDPGLAGQEIAFDASASEDDGEIETYQWDFGDGATAAAATPTANHTYDTAGLYKVKLTVVDDLGAQAEIERDVAIDGPPIAADDGGVVNGAAVYDVLANDRHPRGVAFALKSHDDPAHGTVTCGALGACEYVPDPGYEGGDEFHYTIRDADGREDTATVSLNVPPAGEAPPALLARDDAVATLAGKAVAVLPLANDAGSPPLTIAKVGTPKRGGAADCTPAGACTYTPAAGHSGTDGFTYTVRDGSGAERTAAVQVTILAAATAFTPLAGGAPTSGEAVRQGETAGWTAGASAAGEDGALAALPAPQVSAQLTGEHAVEPASVKTAAGWSAGAPGRAPGAGVTATAGPGAMLGDAVSTSLPRPLPPISQGTGGDGHVPILVGTKVFTTFHHQFPTAMGCADRVTGAVCPGYPKQLTMGANDIPGPAVVIGSKFWVHLHPTPVAGQSAPVGLFCWDADTDRTCGYEILGRVRTTTYADGSAPVLVGGRIYLAAADDKLYCYDPQADAACGTLPLGLGVDTTFDPGFDALANGDHVYVGSKGAGKVACLDVGSGQRCAGWQGSRDVDGLWNLVRRHDAGGDVTGMCVFGSDIGRCWNEATPAQLTPVTGWNVSDTYYNTSVEAEAGSRTLVASHGTGGLFCWDWAAMAPCGAPFDAEGWIHAGKDGLPLPSAYGTVWDGSCAVAVGDPGQIFTVDPAGSAPCTSLGTGTEPQTVDLREQRCDGTVGGAAWVSVDLLDTPPSGPDAELDSFVVTVRDKQTGAVLLRQDLIGGAGKLDLSGISAAGHPAITIEATAAGKAGDPAWSDGIPPRLRVGWKADPQQLCLETKAAVACDDVKPIGISTTLAGVAGAATRQLPTLRALTCNDPPSIELGENRTIDEQTPFELQPAASDPQGGAPALQLVEAPHGMALAGGVISWTPAEAQGPGAYAVKVRATDDGTPALSSEDALTVTVAEVNRKPEISVPGTQLLRIGEAMAAKATATDPDLPAQHLAFSIVSPVGPAVDAGSGAISWIPARPGNFPITVRVTDSGSPPLSAEAAFSTAVAEIDPPPPPPPPPPPAPAAALLLCQTRDLVLEDVLVAGRNVELLGYADLRFAGQPVDIVYERTGKVVATPTVQPDGRFRTTVALPPARERNRARYVARIGGESSLNLKLVRRMVVGAVKVVARRVTIEGRVLPPLARKRADRSIEIRRRVSCGQDEVVGRTTPKPDGRFSVTLDAPADAIAVVYRFATKIRAGKRSRKASKTFTLPRVVTFTG